MKKLIDRLFRRPLPIERPEPSYTVTKSQLTVSPQAVALARARHEQPSPLAVSPDMVFKSYTPAPGVMPEGLAMDSCLPTMAASMAQWAGNSIFHEGQGFFGYPYLAELMQRAEYRHAAEIWAEHSVRKWIKITGGTPEQRDAIEKEFKRLKVRETFREWMLHDNVYGRGQIFLDFDDADRESETARPLTMTASKINERRPLRRLTVVEPMWSAPGVYSTSNPLRADFYKPTQWFVFGRRVHASRMLTIASREVSDMLKPAYSFGGQALVQLMKPYVDNWLRTRQAVSDMVNIYSVLNLKTDLSALLSGKAGDDVYRRAEMFVMTRDNRGLMLTDKEQEELGSIAVPLSGLSELQAQAQEQLASVSRIPLSIYLQITPTGLNATSDGETRNFYADIHAYQEKNARPSLQKVFEVVQFGLFGKVIDGLEFEFEPLWEMSDKDLADIRTADAQADVAYVGAGIIDPEEVRERLANDESSLYHGVDLTDPPPGHGNDGIDEGPEDPDEPEAV